MATDAPVPIPTLPMSYLPPDFARMLELSTYFVIGTLGALIYDVLINLEGDFRIFQRVRFSLPFTAYTISRTATLLYVVLYAIYSTAPFGDCEALQEALSWVYLVAVSGTSLLFFLRVRAVYNKNMYITGLFFFLWLCVAAGCVTISQGVLGINIGPTKYCMNSPNIAAYVTAAVIIPLINDTLVFMFISGKLVSNCHLDFSLKKGVRQGLFGDYMPAFSKGMLQDGQVYYLSTLVLQIVTIIMLLGDTSIAYKTMFAIPNLAVMNIMACRVYRDTFRKISGSREQSTVMNTSSGRSEAIPLSFRRGHPQPQDITLDINKIEVTRTVEQASDYSHRDDNKMHYKAEGNMV
ncbi:hypothetical protein B0H34DRAFT_660307 [Crassisporium funariophilum]|nr:hypothetical protein B0H34DRAFT_660307 [Crassisporium funariophilum]